MDKQPLVSSTQTFCVTPLTPVYIESHTEFEPTHYFIEEGWLYYFDPTRHQDLLSPQDRQELQRLLLQTRFTPEQSCALQRFFYHHRKHFKASVTLVVPVAHTVETHYLQRVGVYTPKHREQKDRPVIPHRLIIERHAFDAYNLEPLIPGGLIKAPLRSALYHTLNAKQRHSGGGYRQRERGGDPLHHVHIQHATGASIARKVMLCTNSLNKPQPRAEASQTVPAVQMFRREMVTGGQYRVLRGEMMITSSEVSQQEYASFAELARLANAYFRPKFNIELHQMEQQGYSNNSWFQGFKQLFNSVLRQAMDEGQAMLLRIGQHNTKGQLLPTAAWFGFHENRDTLFPLGWVILESADASPLQDLKAWCQRQPKPDLKPVWNAIEQERQVQAEKLMAVKQAQEKEQEKAAQQASLEQARKAALDALSPEQRKVEALAEVVEHSPVQSNTGTPLFQQLWVLLQEALLWSETEQRYCEKRFTPLIKIKFPHLGKREKDIKGCLKQLRGEAGQ